MNRTVDKKKFFGYLCSHPAAIKKLVNPTEDFLIECIKNNHECIKFIPKEEQTDGIVLAYLTNAGGYGVRRYLYGNKEVMARLSLDVVKKLIDKDCDNIKYFPQATKEMWVQVAAQSGLCVDFKDIPESILSEDFLISIISNHRDVDDFIKEIPDRLWTVKLIKVILDRDNTCISHIPESIVTKAWSCMPSLWTMIGFLC